MKPSTPANKRKSVGGDSVKLSNKKRKSLDSNDFATKSNGIEESPITPTPGKKIKMFGGTSQLNSSVEGQQKSPKSPQSKKKLFKSPNISNKKTESPESPVDASNAKKFKGGNETTGKAVKPNDGIDISPKKNKKQKKQKVTKEVISEFAGKSRKSRNKFFLKLKERAARDGKAVLADIESRMSDIQNRNELTKTAKRKLTFLKRMKHYILEGGDKNASQNDSNQKQKSKKQKKQKLQQQSVDKPKQVKKATQEDSSSAEEAGNEDAESDSEEGVVTGKMLQGKINQDMEDSDDEVVEEENDSEEKEDEAEAESDESESEKDNDSDVDGAEKKPSKIVSKKNHKEAKKINQEKTIKKDSSISSNKTTDSKQRYVLHVSNLPFDATEAEISAHFQKAGKVISVRIPKGKDSKPRGFGYIEFNSEEEYQKAFSMHHTFIKGRQIKVQFTKPGNKNSEQAKKEIKVKNAKLHAMRKEGKLAGSVKQSQKRSFRRKKKAALSSAGAGDA